MRVVKAGTSEFTMARFTEMSSSTEIRTDWVRVSLTGTSDTKKQGLPTTPHRYLNDQALNGGASRLYKQQGDEP